MKKESQWKSEKDPSSMTILRKRFILQEGTLKDNNTYYLCVYGDMSTAMYSVGIQFHTNISAIVQKQISGVLK